MLRDFQSRQAERSGVVRALTESEKVLRVLGLTISEDNDSITISQPKYVEEMLQEFNQTNCQKRSVPPTEWLNETSENDVEFDNNTFRSAS